MVGVGQRRGDAGRPAIEEALDLVGAKAGLVPLTDETMYLLLVTNEPHNPRMAADRLHVLLTERLAQFGPWVTKSCPLRILAAW